MSEQSADDVRQSIAACLLGEKLGDGAGVNVLTVADLLIRDLPKLGWTFVRSDSWRLRHDFDVVPHEHIDGDVRGVS